MQKIKLVLTLVVLFFICSCQSLGVRKNNYSEEVLRERINTYWNHRIHGEFVETFAMESPGIQKRIKLQHYIQTFVGGISYLAMEIQSVKIEKDAAIAIIKINFRFPLSRFTPKGGHSKTISEYWEFIDNDWYHYIKKPK